MALIKDCDILFQSAIRSLYINLIRKVNTSYSQDFPNTSLNSSLLPICSSKYL
jgi:hypothetical protein